MKIMKRNKRKYEGERMHDNLIADYESALTKDGKTKRHKKTDDNLVITGSQFEDNLNKFLGINTIIDNRDSKYESEEVEEDFESSKFDTNSIQDNPIKSPRESSKRAIRPIQIEGLNNSEGLDDSSRISNSAYRLQRDQKVEPRTPIERTVTQDAAELGVIVPQNVKKAHSDYDKSVDENSGDHLIQPKNKAKGKPSISHGIRTIKEESSSDEDAKEYERKKEEYFNQERLFRRRQIPVEKSVSLLNFNADGFTRIDRIEKLKNEKKQAIESDQLVVDFDDEAFFGKPKTVASGEETSKDQLFEGSEEKSPSKVSIQSDDDYEESLDERVDF